MFIQPDQVFGRVWAVRTWTPAATYVVWNETPTLRKSQTFGISSLRSELRTPRQWLLNSQAPEPLDPRLRPPNGYQRTALYQFS